MLDDLDDTEEVGPLEDDEDMEAVLDEIFDGGDVTDKERLVLSALVFSHEVAECCMRFLTDEMFEASASYAFQFIKEFFADHGLPPDPEEVRINCGLHLFELSGYPRDQDSIHDYLVKKIEDYARRSIIQTDIVHAVEDFDDYQHLRLLMQNCFDRMDAVKASRPEQGDLTDEGYFEELLFWAEENTHDPTGFDMLDEVISVTRPSVNMISASSGIGKSWYLLNQAVRYARQGRNVVLFSLELSKKEADTRLLQIIIGRSMEQIQDDPDGSFVLVKNQYKKMGRIVIEALPMGRATCADLDATVKQIEKQHGAQFGHVIVDHLDHLEPSAGYRVGDIHDRDKKLTVELFNLAQRRDAIVWSASQQVKGAASEMVARVDSLSGGADKMNISANVIILKKTDDTKQSHQVLTGTVVKGRGGGTNMKVPFRFCNKTGRISTPEELRPLFEEMNAPDDSDGKATKPKKSQRDKVQDAMAAKSSRTRAKARKDAGNRSAASVE